MEFFYLLQQDKFAFISVVFIFSLIIGSFLNVIIHRLPIMLNSEWKHDCMMYLAEHGISFSKPDEAKTTYNLISPGSSCPKCGHKISAIENIPVISYIFLGGKCAECKTKISIRYPMVEILCAVLSVIVALKFGYSWQTVVSVFLTWNLIAASFIDYDHKLLPDVMTLPFIWLGLLVNTQGIFTDLQSAVIGAVSGYLFLWCTYQLFKLLTKKEGMGFGDFKLLAVFGAWFGWQSLPMIIIISSLSGAIIGLGLIALKSHDKSVPIPFGPFLAIGGWTTMLWQEQIWHQYLRLFNWQ